jgi:hypothetical protein
MEIPISIYKYYQSRGLYTNILKTRCDIMKANNTLTQRLFDAKGHWLGVKLNYIK